LAKDIPVGNSNVTDHGTSVPGQYAQPAEDMAGYMATEKGEPETLPVVPADAPAMPELATLVMVIAGFAGLGYASFRKNFKNRPPLPDI